MRRLTTPTHVFTLPFDTKIISKMRLVYSQGNTIILVKQVSECQLEGNTIKVRLTQEETKAFDCNKNYAEAQAHILTSEGVSLVSHPYKIPVEKCIDNEVIE